MRDLTAMGRDLTQGDYILNSIVMGKDSPKVGAEACTVLNDAREYNDTE